MIKNLAMVQIPGEQTLKSDHIANAFTLAVNILDQ